MVQYAIEERRGGGQKKERHALCLKIKITAPPGQLAWGGKRSGNEKEQCASPYFFFLFFHVTTVWYGKNCSFVLFQFCVCGGVSVTLGTYCSLMGGSFVLHRVTYTNLRVWSLYRGSSLHVISTSYGKKKNVC